ncbi:type II toxin-antitoxin system prevent-host-death family antitoxin [Microbacterium sp. NPDC089695]|uniref:type II toxin-antitoxin system prevent-host-death family antitoxin n=1 Tax=Microbacterium sp. NPDC089695 TaxID=3364198 RepID=UPI0037F146F9
MTAREFNHSVARAQRVADDQPVMITRRGEPAYVLLNIGEYERLTLAEPRDPRSALAILSPPSGVSVDDDEFDEVLADIRANTPDRPPVEFD